MPFIIFFAAVIIVIVANVSKQQKLQQKRAQEQARAQRQVMAAEGASSPGSTGAYEGAGTFSDAERIRRQEELKRRILENRARRLAEAAQSAAATARTVPSGNPVVMAEQRPAAGSTLSAERRPLEKRVLEKNIGNEKPVVAHADDDCGGGSIHDGYHEGVTQFAGKPAASVAGKLGRRLADEDDRIDAAAKAAQNAKRAMARISKLPPLAQGVIYSEILGKPRSETA